MGRANSNAPARHAKRISWQRQNGHVADRTNRERPIQQTLGVA
jgi:hypothetical protein